MISPSMSQSWNRSFHDLDFFQGFFSRDGEPTKRRLSQECLAKDRYLRTPRNSIGRSLEPSLASVAENSVIGENRRECCYGGYRSFVGLLFTLCLGQLWTYGNALPYIASYLTYHSTEDPTKNDYKHYTSLTNWCFFLIFTSLTFGVLIGGKIEVYAGPRITILISSIFLLGGFGGTYIALMMNSVFLTLLSYGSMFGFGVGLGYPVLTVVCMRWFPDYHGRVCGIISAVFGGSPLLWDYIQTFIINPHNYTLDDDMGYVLHYSVIEQVPWMFAVISFIMFIMIVISLICIHNPPWYISERDARKNSQVERSDEQQKYEADSLNLQQTLRTFTFWSLWINNFIYSFVLMFVAAEWKQLATEHLHIDNDHYLAIVGSVGSMFNGFGRLGWGLIYDINHSFRISMGGQTAVVGIFLITIAMLKFFEDATSSFMKTEYTFGLWMCIIWLCVGCQYGFFPSCVARTFGVKYTGSILGLFIWCEAPASLIVVVVTQYREFIFGGWFFYLVFMGSCSLVSTLLSIIYRPELDRASIIAKDKSASLINGFVESNGNVYQQPRYNDENAEYAVNEAHATNDVWVWNPEKKDFTRVFNTV